jgi:hypothetical protein
MERNKEKEEWGASLQDGWEGGGGCGRPARLPGINVNVRFHSEREGLGE